MLTQLMPMIWLLTLWIVLMGTLRILFSFDWDWSHFWSQFDKLLLVFLVLFYSLLGWHAAYHGASAGNAYVQKFAEAMLDNQKLVIGALLGLITGRAIQRQIDSQTGAKDAAQKS